MGEEENGILENINRSTKKGIYSLFKKYWVLLET